MAKFEIRHGKAVKSYDKETGNPIHYEIGEEVEVNELPANLVGKCRELAENPKDTEKPKAKTAKGKKSEKEYAENEDYESNDSEEPESDENQADLEHQQ